MFLARGPLIGTWVRPDASVAVWDVSQHAPRADMSGRAVYSVALA